MKVLVENKYGMEPLLVFEFLIYFSDEMSSLPFPRGLGENILES